MSILLGRQPILDQNQQVVAYELLFRSLDHSIINSDTEATANVIANTLSVMPINNVLNNKKGFINIGIEILRKGLLDILPPNRFIIEILENQEPSAELLSAIQKLKKRGYIFALDDFVITNENIHYWKAILEEVSIVKVDLLDTQKEDLINKTELLRTFNVQLLAEKVETEESFLLCKELKYEYYQGYFFAKPDILKATNISPSMHGILSIIKLLQQEANITEIEQTLKIYPELIISLLKIVNSSSVSPIQEITSVKQAIALLGKKAFTQWILLLLYSQKSKGAEQQVKDDPLFCMATQRGKLMENILTYTTPKASKNLKDTAFLIGLLSLSDTLLNTPIQEIAQELHLSKEITDAIIHQKGELGVYLKLTKSLEVFDTDTFTSIANTLKISPEAMNEILLSAIKFSKNLANKL